MNKTVLLTGATRGIGKELTKQLTAQGFTVFATGRTQTLLQQLKEETGCLGATADLSKPEEVTALYAQAKSELGTVDILINNAGFNDCKDPVTDISLDNWEAQYAVNLRAPFLLCQAAMRDMLPKKEGHIINILSTLVWVSQANYSLYSTMKYALQGFTNCLRKEAQPANIKVTAVCPGGTDSDFRPADRPDYMRSDSVAKMILQCINAPDDLVVHDLTFRPMIEGNF
jgi:NAD(P)-dependent dehydrogenase (short-subunit alcohol dehydrogenase family)